MGHISGCYLLSTLLLLPQTIFAQTAASKAADKAARPAVAKPVPQTSPYTIRAVIFQGDVPYSRAALTTVCGLKLGAAITTQDLQAGAERLIDTGAFDDVSATLDGAEGKSINVVFSLKPTSPTHVLRVSFDNFVWFTRAELVAGVERRVPLFNGTVPEGGNVQEAVRVALQEMLAAKGVTATVSSDLMAPHPGQPYRLADYRVTKPEVMVHALDVAGVPAAFAATTKAVVGSLIGTAYNDGLVDGLSEKVLADYKNAGYLDASLSGLTTAIAASTPFKVEVDVQATVQAGEVYWLSKLEWAGSPVMSAAAFTAAAKIRPGEVASEQGVRASVENLDAAYRDHGYMDVVLNAVPTVDRTKHQVSYAVLATPGAQYKLRELKVVNLTPEQRRDFDRGWRLKPGDVYDAGYVTSFLKNNTALPSLQKLAASYRVTEEPDSDVLDLEIVFRKGVAK